MTKEKDKMKRGGRPTAAGSLELTSRIVHAATRSFLDKGYSDTAMEEISVDSGVAKRSLYSRFPSKADLFRQVVLTYSDNTLGRLKLSKADKRPVNEQLYDGCIRILEIVLKPDVIAMERLVLSEAIRFPELTQGVQMARHQGELYLLSILEETLAVPEGGRDLASRGAKQLWDLVIAPYVRDSVLVLMPGRLTEDTEGRVREGISLLLHGLLGDS
ncbi:TetR/AcrR family transcriptional regulator [Sphingobium sp. YR768]|uniref:TetR/AcrR family transcriptional regulator n=1 Tax=Sphingobium sp. YR768 TaxID=1884365 RepID=UPI0008ABAC50|nr:TetR/AcrR family transcriptional regulator [Sphingobium sp. YR768]SER22813.1 transcriptional regulator, TetR family [Sphingobium sp. YR768]